MNESKKKITHTSKVASNAMLKFRKTECKLRNIFSLQNNQRCMDKQSTEFMSLVCSNCMIKGKEKIKSKLLKNLLSEIEDFSN